MKVLDIGGGTHPYKNENEDVIHMDFYAIGKGFLKHNAEKIPYPFPANNFDKIYASHILEHLSNLWIEQNKRCVMDELWRILKSEGKLIIRMPHPSVCYNWGHPTHKRTASMNSFDFILPKCPERYTKKSWIIIKKELRYNRLYSIGRIITKLANLNSRAQYLFERFLCYWLGGFDESYFELKPFGKNYGK